MFTEGSSKIRWRSLRDLYKKKKKEKKLEKSGTRKSFETWPYSHLMTFLEANNFDRSMSCDNLSNNQDNSDHELHNPGEGDTTLTIKTEELLSEDMTAETCPSTSNIDLEPETQVPKPPKNNVDIEIGKYSVWKLLAEVTRERKQWLSDTNDPISLFFRGMAETVKTFPPDLVAKAKLRVCEVITNLELEVDARSHMA